MTNKIQLSSCAPTRGWCCPSRRPEQPTGLWPGQSTGKWAISQTLLAASRSQQGQALQVDILVARLSVGGRKRCQSQWPAHAQDGAAADCGEKADLLVASFSQASTQGMFDQLRQRKEKRRRTNKTAPSATWIEAQTMKPKL